MIDSHLSELVEIVVLLVELESEQFTLEPLQSLATITTAAAALQKPRQQAALVGLAEESGPTGLCRAQDDKTESCIVVM